MVSRTDVMMLRYFMNGPARPVGTGAMKRMLKGIFTVLLLFPFLAACQQQESDTAGLTLISYNHTDRGLAHSVNRAAGAYVAPHSGGGSVSCCVRIADEWHEGMEVPITWNWNGTDEWLEGMVPVQEFGEGDRGLFAVHFMRSGEIKAIVTMLALTHPDYPLKGDEALLYPLGESPREIRDRARNGTPEEQLEEQIAQLRRYHIGNSLTDEQLRPFVREQIAKAQAYGLTDLDEQYGFLRIAMFTSGAFVEHPAVQARLADRDNPEPFRYWQPPDDIYDLAPPLWETMGGGQEEAADE